MLNSALFNNFKFSNFITILRDDAPDTFWNEEWFYEEVKAEIEGILHKARQSAKSAGKHQVGWRLFDASLLIISVQI